MRYRVSRHLTTVTSLIVEANSEEEADAMFFDALAAQDSEDFDYDEDEWTEVEEL